MLYIILLCLVLLGSFGIYLWRARRIDADSRSATADSQAKAQVFVSIAVSAIALVLVVTFVCSLVFVPTGQVAVLTLFGKIQEGYVPDQGIAFANPIKGSFSVNIQRQEVVHEDGKIRTGAQGQNYLTVDIVMPYSVNPATAWRVLTVIPDYQTMMNRQADAALRQGISEHPWTEVVNNSDGKVAGSIETAWKAMVKSQLLAAGLNEKEAEVAFSYYPVQIRSAVPDQVVQDAAAAKAAAQQNLDTQGIQTEIAGKIADRRTNEGEGLRNLVLAALGLKVGDELPLTPDQITAMIDAIANMERASAVVKFADDPKRPVTLILSNGDNGVAVRPGENAAEPTPAPPK